MKTSWIAALALGCASMAAAAASHGAISLPAPLPEADAYGMLLAGLGCLALVGRRRQMPALPYARLHRLAPQDADDAGKVAQA
jgi:hypothetical protein